MRFKAYRFFVVVVASLSLFVLGDQQTQAEIIARTNFVDGGDGTLTGDTSGKGWADDGWVLQDANLGGAIVPVDWVHKIPGGGNITAQTALQFVGSPLGSGVSRDLASVVDADDIYISFLTKWETGVINGNDFVIWYFGTNGGPNIGYKSNEGTGDEGLDFVARTNGSTNQYSTDIKVGELYFVVGHLSKSDPSGFYDRYELWVNPSQGDQNVPQSVSEGASNVSEFSTVGVRTHQINAGGAEPDDLRFGRLTIATSWEEVLMGDEPPPTPGDFNDDGAVDIGDFDILAANMYAHLDGVRGFENGDMNRNGRIDLADFHEFVAVFSAPAGAAAVPEPSALLLVVAPLILLVRWTRSSRRA